MSKAEELAITILDLFENLLEENNITIPDEDRTGEESEARLYGATYYNLQDSIIEVMKKSEIIEPIYFLNEEEILEFKGREL